MNVLIVLGKSRYEKSAQYTESSCFKRVFNEFGHDVVIWGKGHSNFEDKIDFNSFDVIITAENYGDDWLPDLSNTSKPYKILWSIDSHTRGEEPFEEIFAKGKYHLLLHSNKLFANGDKRVWFPNAYDDNVIKRLDTPKNHFIGFCGNYVNRKHILDILTITKGLKQDILVVGDDMVKAINSYHIHFNKNISIDLNYRNFETLGCGTMLLTDFKPDYLELGFSDFENCVFYRDFDELIDRIDYLRNNPIMVETISNAGFELAKKHTYRERVKKLLEYIKVA